MGLGWVFAVAVGTWISDAARAGIDATPLRTPAGFAVPLPGGVVMGYEADTGLDVMGMSLPVHAIAAGRVEYAEAGHTLWQSGSDTPYTVRIRLDQPIPWHGHRITHVYYGHLAALAFEQHEDAAKPRHVAAGTRLGVSGRANGCWHLHLGLLLDGDVSQRWGTFLLASEIRDVLGPYRLGARLPRS